MSYAGKPIDADRLAVVILVMIESHRDRPCPTRHEVQQWTGIARRRVWRFLAELQERGLIEIECYGQGDNVWRRMRVRGGAWTGWTVRKRRLPAGSTRRAQGPGFARSATTAAEVA